MLNSSTMTSPVEIERKVPYFEIKSFISKFFSKKKPADKETKIAVIKGPEFDNPHPTPIPRGLIREFIKIIINEVL